MFPSYFRNNIILNIQKSKQNLEKGIKGSPVELRKLEITVQRFKGPDVDYSDGDNSKVNSFCMTHTWDFR